MKFLPYGRQFLDADDIAAVTQVLNSDYLTTGPAVDAFEAALADRLKVGHAVACSSGTAALHLSYMALDLGPGDRVIVPSMTFSATAATALLLGAEVTLADVDPRSGLMRPEHVLAALGDNPRDGKTVVAPVHLNGQCAPPGALAALAQDHGFMVVEDACHALGTTYGAEALPIGGCRHSQMACFSFHPVKTIAMGEGGAITTNDGDLAVRLRALRSHGQSRDPATLKDPSGRDQPWYYEIQELGLNYRASDLHCALARSQLDKLPRFVARRRQLVRLYDQALARLAPLVSPVARQADCTAAWHLYAVLIDFATAKRNRAQVMEALRDQGVGSQVHYIPLHRQPVYAERNGPISLPGAERYYDQVLSLPLFVGMEDGDVDRVVTALSQALDL